jgi:hypothetical protein
LLDSGSEMIFGLGLPELSQNQPQIVVGFAIGRVDADGLL